MQEFTLHIAEIKGTIAKIYKLNFPLGNPITDLIPILQYGHVIPKYQPLKNDPS